MASQLSPVTANFFFEHNEERVLFRAIPKLVCQFCYVRDIFMTWQEKLKEFPNHINSTHKHIHSTVSP
jgi:hypothetical protein